MYQEQRLEKILELLEERKQLSAKEMVDYFKVSKDTIRRDFALLSQRQLVRRTHGGLQALGTDGIGSDMFEEMKFAFFKHRDAGGPHSNHTEWASVCPALTNRCNSMVCFSNLNWSSFLLKT